MDNNTFQQKFDLACELKKEKEYEKANSIYSELYEQLIRDGFKNTGKPTESEKEDEERINNYLKGDNLACTILNNIAVILAEVGNKEGAKNYFELSIKLTPDGLDYQNPIKGLKQLEN